MTDTTNGSWMIRQLMREHLQATYQFSLPLSVSFHTALPCWNALRSTVAAHPDLRLTVELTGHNVFVSADCGIWISCYGRRARCLFSLYEEWGGSSWQVYSWHRRHPFENRTGHLSGSTDLDELMHLLVTWNKE